MEAKLSRGLDLAYERMIAFKKQRNSKLVVMRNGKIVAINP